MPRFIIQRFNSKRVLSNRHPIYFMESVANPKQKSFMEVMGSYMLFNSGSGQCLKKQCCCSHQKSLSTIEACKDRGHVTCWGLKTTTKEALHEVIDENSEGLFPSLKAVSKAKKH
jgi:hypothetical protein